MKNKRNSTLAYGIVCLSLLVTACGGPGVYEPKSGDLIFQVSPSAQSQAIQLATGSKYSHVGMVVIRENDTVVFEAVQPVRITPLAEFVVRGVGRHYVAKRVKDDPEKIAQEISERVEPYIYQMSGTGYDFAFGWSDDRLYCSELVWKVYERALGVELCPLKALRDFNLSSPLVKSELQRRYGGTIPYEEPVVSPGDLFDSDLLETVGEGGVKTF